MTGAGLSEIGNPYGTYSGDAMEVTRYALRRPCCALGPQPVVTREGPCCAESG